MENITIYYFETITQVYFNESDLVMYSPAIEPNTNQKSLLYPIFIISLSSIIIAMNLFVVISSGLILKKGSKPRSTYLFLGNNAMCDLLTGLAFLFPQLYPKSFRGQTTCIIQLGMIVSSVLTSFYSVGLIAIDRYLYIIHGLKYQRWVYPNRARICILFTWIIGVTIGFFPLLGYAGNYLKDRDCWFIKLVPQRFILISNIIAIIPIIIVIVLYSIILYHALQKVVTLKRAQSKADIPENNNDLRIFVGQKTTNQEPKVNIFRRMFIKKKNAPIDLKGPSKTKAIIVVLLVTGSFVITWVPSATASIIYSFCDLKKTPETCKNLQYIISIPLTILGLCNSLLNPIIYAWWHPGFRNSVKKIFKRNKDILSSSFGENTKSTSRSTQKITISVCNSVQEINQIEENQINTHM